MATSPNTARALLARNLRRIRLERGLTQEKLSLESGVMQSHLSEIEAGKRNATVDLIGAVAQALGLPVALLFEERPPARPSSGVKRMDDGGPAA